MGKKSSLQPLNEGVTQYPSVPPGLAEPDNTDLPGNLPPLADGETDSAPPVTPLYDEADMPYPDELQHMVDTYTPPFQPMPAPKPPSLVPQNKISQQPLTKPVGLAMSSYLYSRSRRPPPQPSLGGQSASDVPDGAIMTTQPAALKQAMNLVGLQSPNNPNGLGINIDTARQVMFGKSSIGEVNEASFRAAMQSGDINIDKKKIRQFVNYDGSTTYEILNDDKSIMSRFTIGDYKGKKLFVQGGYSAYAQALKDVAAKLGAMQAGSSEFDRVRNALTGRG